MVAGNGISSAASPKSKPQGKVRLTRLHGRCLPSTFGSKWNHRVIHRRTWPFRRNLMRWCRRPLLQSA